VINQNKMAVEISKLEGGEIEVNIGQIKEVMKHHLDLLAKEKPSDVLALLEKRNA